MKYVLIAEDDPAIARLLGDGIGDQLDVETDVIMNGALVPDAIAARRPDLIVLDVALPGLSGIDIFDLVRGQESLQSVPVLFLTASPERARSVFAPAGVHRVMAKPFDLAALVTAVREMLAAAAESEAAA